jgi:hypothetical protein
MGGTTHLIKKYANRKLYDTAASRYVTLEAISRLVRDGVDIRVVERDSGRDLTALVLSQIVMTEEKRRDTNGDEGVQERRRTFLGYVRRAGDPGAGEGRLEEIVEAAVERALARFSFPTRRELEALSGQVDELRRRIARAEAGDRPGLPRRGPHMAPPIGEARGRSR